MDGRIYCIACALLFPQVPALAAEAQNKNEPRMVSGMSIVGNDETPKSLYFVPWKNAEGDGTNFSSSIMGGELKPIDKDEFIRELEFYRQRKQNQSAITN